MVTPILLGPVGDFGLAKVGVNLSSALGRLADRSLTLNVSLPFNLYTFKLKVLSSRLQTYIYFYPVFYLRLDDDQVVYGRCLCFNWWLLATSLPL